MGIICETCGRDIDALGQDNMGAGAPLCEDCWGKMRKAAAGPDVSVQASGPVIASLAASALRSSIESAYAPSRERSLALTKLEECELWLRRCKPEETAAPAMANAARYADAPTLGDSHVPDFKLPDLMAKATPGGMPESVEKAIKAMPAALQMAVR